MILSENVDVVKLWTKIHVYFRPRLNERTFSIFRDAQVVASCR